MNEHDEIDQARREFGSLAGKLKDAAVAAGQWNQTRVHNAERAREQVERIHDRAAQRAERALRMAERAQRIVRTHWKQIDRTADADLAVELETARAMRAEQEQLVAQWAWAQAHADENPQAAAEFDDRIRREIGIDPELLRNPIANEPTQPFTPIRTTSAVGESADPGDGVTGAPGAVDATALDEAALIQGLIDAAHPDHGTSEPTTPSPVKEPRVNGVGLDQHVISADLESDLGGGEGV
ncbi:hypothetical protein [Nocardia sp. CDC160]|uniref:hypothetical protein n=1 Tax=Nocardia sp. CDC160 TaxID=3112166 RepID=UPI002DBE0021|nr:hypothetical protein [Nocardia sp. CDC160]MEC3919327.1 hypothetical protein [Nocardia sp. CDC160]